MSEKAVQKPGRGRHFLLAAAVLAAGVGASAQVGLAPAASAAEPTVADITCAGSVKFFQLREGDPTNGFSELWAASTGDPTNASAPFYNWRKIHNFDVKVKSIAAHDQTKDSVYLYASNVQNRLVEYRFDLSQADLAGSKALTPDSADHGFTSLASDGKRLFGIDGGKLYVMPLPDNWTKPSGKAPVTGVTTWPNAFFGVANHAGDYELAYTNDDGYLRYVDVDYADGRWTAAAKTVRQEGWSNSTISSPGGGLLMRFGLTEDSLSNQLAGNPDGGLNTPMTGRMVLQRSTFAKDNPVTTVPNLCSVTQQAPPPATSPLVTEARKFLGDDGGQCKAFITF
ncbi:MAG TPA: hypothetical protein VM677_15895, partial [Actinokineospora sp.]|nr:hypothetical protein [Actinokineospora sp.]